LVNRFSVKWTPTLIILDANGREHHRFVGFLPPEDFIGQIILGKGKAEFNIENLEEAIQDFQELLVCYPKAGAAPEARYYLGVAKYKVTHDPGELRATLEILQRDYAGSEWTRKAQVYALIPG